MSVCEKTREGLPFDPDVEFLDLDNISSGRIERLLKELGAPDNPLLFPPHFLNATFPKIGGDIMMIGSKDDVLGGIFLFPRKIDNKTNSKVYTARVHSTPKGKDRFDRADFCETIWQTGFLEPYYPTLDPIYTETHNYIGNFDFGSPSKKEAEQIRNLQKIVWGSEDKYLYPSDIHSSEFKTPNNLIVRADNKVVGFLFGFYKFSDEKMPKPLNKYRSDLRIESQLLGVLPDYRRQGLALELKKQQALSAKAEGIDIINWTVDPLQLPNAILNFGKLRSISYKHYRNYYDFSNVLNQVPASRLEVSWLISSPRTESILSSSSRLEADILDISTLNDVLLLNHGAEKIDFEVNDAEWLAVEVPSSWTELQTKDRNKAMKWRETTDTIFQYYLGPQGRNYAISEVGKLENKNFLLAQKLSRISRL